MNPPIIHKDQKNSIKLLPRYSGRGVIRCKLCGHLNGNRAKGCKNNSCTLFNTFKKPPKINITKLPVKLDTVQLISTNDFKLFSIQIRDGDIEHRSFVQIIDKTLLIDEHNTIINRKTICYVDTCLPNKDESCVHVQNSLENINIVQAEPLDINITLWYQMTLSEETKNRIWKLYCESQLTTPIVQRVNKTIFVIKCNEDVSAPVGLLHIALDGPEIHPNYSCACKRLKIVMSPKNNILLDSDKCDHLYLLIAAILSNENLKIEFNEHIKLLKDMYSTSNESILEDNFLITEDFIKFSENILNDMELSNEYLDCIFENDTISSSAPIIAANNLNTLQTNSNNYHQTIDESYHNASDTLINNNCKVISLDQFKNQPNIECNNKIFANDNNNEIIELLSVNEDNKIISSKMKRKRQTKIVSTKNDDDNLSNTINETHFELLAFENWFSSVIERINLTMDYNQNGKPDQLIFSVSKEFFYKLRNRFTNEKNKIRLPNNVQTFPYGTRNLKKYTWSFGDHNIVQRIFSTSIIKLEIERTFTETFENYYEYCGNKELQDQCNYQTFLKIKSNDPIKFMNNFFTIDWIPNVLPISGYGEMRIYFTFGFMKNKEIIEK